MRGSTWNIFRKSFSRRRYARQLTARKIVAVMELAMVEKLLAGAGKMRDVVAAHQAGERLLPLNRQPFEFLEESGVDQRGWFHRTAAALTCSMIWLRIVSGVCPSACASKFKMMR